MENDNLNLPTKKEQEKLFCEKYKISKDKIRGFYYGEDGLIKIVVLNDSIDSINLSIVIED